MKAVGHYFLEFSSINVSTWIDIKIFFFLNFGNYLSCACKGVDFFPFTDSNRVHVVKLRFRRKDKN